MSESKNPPENSTKKTRLYAPVIKEILAEEGGRHYPVTEDIDKRTEVGLIKYATLCARHSAYNVLDACIKNKYGLRTSDAKSIWKIFINSLKQLPKYSGVLIEEIKEVYKAYTDRYLDYAGYVGLSSPCDFWMRLWAFNGDLRNTMAVLAAYGIPAYISDSKVYSPDFTQYGVSDLGGQRKTKDWETTILSRAELALNTFIKESERINGMFLATRNTSRLTPGGIAFVDDVGWAFVLLPQTCFMLKKDEEEPEDLIEEIEYGLEFKRRIMDNVPSNLFSLYQALRLNGMSPGVYEELSDGDKVKYRLLFGDKKSIPSSVCPMENVFFNPSSSSYNLKEEMSFWIKHEIDRIPKERWEEPFIRGKLELFKALKHAYEELSDDEETFELSKALFAGWSIIYSWHIRKEKIDFETDNVSVLYSKNTFFKILHSIIKHPLSLSDMPSLSGLLDEKVELVLLTTLRHNMLDENVSIKELLGWISPLLAITRQLEKDTTINLALTFPNKKIEELAELF